jgi:uric acid-xanthine permease
LTSLNLASNTAAMEPDRIGPDTTLRVPLADRLKNRGHRIVKGLTTRDGLIGDYDYAFLFKPRLPFMRKPTQAAPFFGLNDKMPILLALLLGFQHALAMLAGLITPPIILAGTGGANLTPDQSRYLVSASLIFCGIGSAVQITRFHIYKTPYW